MKDKVNHKAWLMMKFKNILNYNFLRLCPIFVTNSIVQLMSQRFYNTADGSEMFMNMQDSYLL